MSYLRGLLLVLVALPLAAQSTPVIVVNNLTGVAPASGTLGFTVFQAIATCHTNGVASTTITWTAHGQGGTVPVDGSAVLFLATPSGRQRSEITAYPTVNTITVEDSFNIAAASAVDCAVGGRVLALGAQLFTDIKGNHGAPTHGADAGGWELHIEETGTNYVTGVSLGTGATTSGCGIYGIKDGAGTRPIIEGTFQPGTLLDNNVCDIESLHLINTNATKTGAVAIEMGDFSWVRDSIFGGANAAQSFETAIIESGANTKQFTGNEVRFNVLGIDMGEQFVAGNYIHDNTDGVEMTGAANSWFMRNIVADNTRGIDCNNNFSPPLRITENTFDGNTTAIRFQAAGCFTSLLFASNLITSNTTGVDASAVAASYDRQRASALIDFNAYGTGGAANGADISSFVQGPNTIAADPLYVNAAGGDYTPTNANVAFRCWPPGLNGITPRDYPGTLTSSELRCGAIQPAGGGAGGFSNIAP